MIGTRGHEGTRRGHGPSCPSQQTAERWGRKGTHPFRGVPAVPRCDAPREVTSGPSVRRPTAGALSRDALAWEVIS